MVRKWYAIAAEIPALREDLRRLQGNETLLSPHDAERLDQLRVALKQVEEEMEHDETQVGRWREIRREIREIERRGNTLDPHRYQRLFNMEEEGRPAFHDWIDPRITPAQRASRLEEVIATIEDVGREIAKGIEVVQSALHRSIAERALPPASGEHRRKRLEGELRAIEERRKETRQRRNDRRKRLAIVLGGITPQNDRPLSEWARRAREKIKEEIETLRRKIEEDRTFRQAWAPILETWVNDLENPQTVQNDRKFLLDAYIEACNVVGITCTERRSTLVEKGHPWFDVVIVDEVSKATPPELIMPLMIGRKGILVGDHRQLPPLFREHGASWEEAVAEQAEEGDGEQDPSSELTQENLERFRKMVTASFFKEHFEKADPSLKSTLWTQYRMHPEIMRVINHFYDHRLKCGLEDPDTTRNHDLTLHRRGRAYVTPARHVLWIDSSKDPTGHPYHERQEEATSKVNDLEALLVAACLIDLERACREAGYGQNGKGKKRVGVISFYTRQIRAIREMVKRLQKEEGLRFSAIHYDVNTVDRYQGQERPIVIVSMVRNPPWRLSRRANPAKFERINVAFSRAQELLVIVGAKDVFADYPVRLPAFDRPGEEKSDRIYRRIIEEIDRQGGFFRSGDLLSSEDCRFIPPNPTKPKRAREFPGERRSSHRPRRPKDRRREG
ncbi:MAG: hypothetical protein D6795_05840 [Deltaproteobacteria bacterium]|nr:MAG: hypothetical protein D6795_05840 [Deltaproteobacteria bacterium]